MSIKVKLFLKDLSRKFSKKWYKTMKPLATYLSKREDRRYQEFKDRLTEDRVVKLFAKDIVKYLVRYNGQKIRLIVAEYISREDFSGSRCLAYDNYSLIRSKKAKRAYYATKRTVEFQMKVIEQLKNTKGVTVEEIKEEFEPWYHIKGYVMTYKISVG